MVAPGEADFPVQLSPPLSTLSHCNLAVAYGTSLKLLAELMNRLLISESSRYTLRPCVSGLLQACNMRHQCILLAWLMPFTPFILSNLLDISLSMVGPCSSALDTAAPWEPSCSSLFFTPCVNNFLVLWPGLYKKATMGLAQLRGPREYYAILPQRIFSSIHIPMAACDWSMSGWNWTSWEFWWLMA